MANRWKFGYLVACYLAIVQLSFASEKELKQAIVAEDIALAQRLVSEGVDVNKIDRVVGAPLHYAAIKGRSEIVLLLLDAGAEIDATTRTHPKKQAIHLASANGHLQIVSLLLEKGADVNALSSRGATALHEAVVGEFREVARLLTESGADINAVDEDKRWTPLHQAVRLNSPEMASLLLELEADPNARDLKGYTPLRVLLNTISIDNTTDSTDYALIVELLEQGVKVDSEDEDWVGMVATIDNAELVRLLKEHIEY